MVAGFPDKLTFVLKSLSISRVSLAAGLGVNKSVVSRWVSGATTPSEYNLSRLSAHLGKLAPGFTALDWDRDLEDLATVIGVGRAAAPAPPPAKGPSLTLHFGEEIRAATKLRAEAYEGIYKSTRPYAVHPGRHIHDHILVRLGPDGLMVTKMITGGVRVEGWVLTLNNQLFTIGSEFTSGAMTFGLFHGVNTRTVDLIDGIVLTPTLDMGRTPTASRMVLQRIRDLSDDPEADDACLEELASHEPVAPTGSIPEEVLRLLASGPADEADFLRGLLRLPLARSIARGTPPTFP